MTNILIPPVNVLERCVGQRLDFDKCDTNRRRADVFAEMTAKRAHPYHAGRLTAKDYQRAVLYSTLSPCDMCSGAILLYKIPKVVIGENRTFKGPEEYLRSRGVDLEIIDSKECYQMMQDFIRANDTLWNEDIGE